jgi:hypothetical protein
MTFLNLIKETYSILEAPETPQDAAMPDQAQQQQAPAENINPDDFKKQMENQMEVLGSVLKTTFLILAQGSKELSSDSMLRTFVNRMKEASDLVDVDLPKALSDFDQVLKDESSKFGVSYDLNTLKPD